MLSMVLNDNAGNQTPRSALSFFVGTPPGACSLLKRVSAIAAGKYLGFTEQSTFDIFLFGEQEADVAPLDSQGWQDFAFLETGTCAPSRREKSWPPISAFQ